MPTKQAKSYQVMPSLTEDELNVLQADIEENGIRVPIDVDEDGNILDGYNRKAIADKLGMKCPQRTVKGLTDEQKREYALVVNIARRHLTREQRRELVSKLRKEGWSLRRIGEALGIPYKTAHRDVQATQSTAVPGDTPQTVKGKDQKSYPATQPKSDPATQPKSDDAKPPTADRKGVSGGRSPREKGRTFQRDMAKLINKLGGFKNAKPTEYNDAQEGDIRGVPNWSFECKNEDEYRLGPWIDQAEQQAQKADAGMYAVIAKRKGKTDAAKQFVILETGPFVSHLAYVRELEDQIKALQGKIADLTRDTSNVRELREQTKTQSKGGEKGNG